MHQVKGKHVLTAALMSAHAKEKMIVLHPLPRVDEIGVRLSPFVSLRMCMYLYVISMHACSHIHAFSDGRGLGSESGLLPANEEWHVCAHGSVGLASWCFAAMREGEIVEGQS